MAGASIRCSCRDIEDLPKYDLKAIKKDGESSVSGNLLTTLNHFTSSGNCRKLLSGVLRKAKRDSDDRKHKSRKKRRSENDKTLCKSTCINYIQDSKPSRSRSASPERKDLMAWSSSSKSSFQPRSHSKTSTDSRKSRSRYKPKFHSRSFGINSFSSRKSHSRSYGEESSDSQESYFHKIYEENCLTRSSSRSLSPADKKTQKQKSYSHLSSTSSDCNNNTGSKKNRFFSKSRSTSLESQYQTEDEKRRCMIFETPVIAQFIETSDGEMQLAEEITSTVKTTVKSDHIIAESTCDIHVYSCGHDVTQNRPMGDMRHPFYMLPDDVEMYQVRCRNGLPPLKALHELCKKNDWALPFFVKLPNESFKIFKFSLILNDHRFVMNKEATKKKVAKEELVKGVLQWLNIVPRD